MNTTQAMNGVPHERDIACISKEIDIRSSIRKDPVPEKLTHNTDDGEDPRNFIIPVYKKFKIRIYKPLIPLKLALFVWYGAGSAVSTFLVVFMKQKGITLSELSTIYAISPAAQFLGPTICGIIADKIGRSKPVLVVNLLLTVLIVIGMLAAPSFNFLNCDPQPISLKCHREEFDRLIAKTRCDVNTDAIELTSCNMTCPENVTQYCHGQNLICDVLAGNEDFNNFSLSVHVSWAYKLESKCYYNVTSMSHKNVTYSWCNVPHKMYCKISCLMDSEEGCSDVNSGRTGILILNTVLLILFFTVFSNSYRFLDVTSMSLVKEHNSDFGRERFFSITGILVFSPFAGYIVGETTLDGGDKNYNTAFYLAIAMIFILLAILYKLDVQINPPGKNMWKKSLYLLKNPDVIAFVVVLLVLGTAWGFTKNYLFWFLEDMNSPSVLLGLISAVSALYGLPFLVTSNWWVKKIGATQIFILGLLGYVVCCIGYSLLYDPWLSLLVEATNIVTYHLLWVAVIVHSHSLAPEGLTATIISMAGGLHYSLAGKGTGGFFGGMIMNAFGPRIAYRVMALICLIVAVFYAIYLYIRRTCYTVNPTMDVINGVGNQEQNELKTISGRV